MLNLGKRKNKIAPKKPIFVFIGLIVVVVLTTVFVLNNKTVNNNKIKKNAITIHKKNKISSPVQKKM